MSDSIRQFTLASARAIAALVVLAPSVAVAQGQPVRPVAPLVGFGPTMTATQRRVEQDVIAAPQPARARQLSRDLSREPHVAGTPAQERTRDYVIARMKEMGLETEARGYDVWLPHATSVKVTRMGRDTTVLDLSEPAIEGDAVTAMAQYLTVNGSSAAGVAEGEIVFVNYGLIEDYATLDSLGVSVKGKIVLARYGRSFRGIKAREAEKRGALATLIYTDPADDGFARGDVYPEGPMRPMRGVQRGSVFNGTGDPLTPGYASKPGAPRLAVAQTALPRIPVVPISAANAQLLLAGVRGTAIPAGWQGGLPLRYHIGAGPTRARVEVTTDAATNGTKTIWNTLGYLRGSEFPDQYVYIGAHRDGWGAGAADNVSGTVSVLEAAKALSDMAKRGVRPKRTIVFATWDAEEWGLIGSTEFVEDDSLRLQTGAVAYLNQDVAAQGSSFGGGGSPSLRATLRDVVRGVPDPKGRGSVYAAWRAAAGLASAGLASDSLEPAMGDPGGGSDFAGFYNHLGIPIADWGFGGPAGTYHSAYDTFAWMERFGDPEFTYHATAARVGAAMALRVANADILPYDYAEFARTMRRYVPPVQRALGTKGWDAAAVSSLGASIDAMERAAVNFAQARDAALASEVPKASRVAANGALMRVERAFARPSGLTSRPWYRSLIYASDVDNGYSTMSFPGVNEAIRAGDRALTTTELADLTARFGAASSAIGDATRALQGRAGETVTDILDARYSRQLVLRGFGPQGQQRLAASRVLIVGAGGLGAPAAMYLAAAGVGTITLVDSDVVDVSNLHRQLLYGTGDVGSRKLDAAQARLTDINPHVTVGLHDTRLDASNAAALVAGHHVVIDATDNFPTRYAINDACLAASVPFVYGSVARFEGQVTVFAMGNGPCYRCLFPEPPAAGAVPTCAEEGVLGVVPGIIGLHQAMEAIKLLAGIGTPLAGRLMLFDLLENDSRLITIDRRADCPACGAVRVPNRRQEIRVDSAPLSFSQPIVQLAPAALDARLREDAPPLVLDVREQWEYDIAHLDGSQLVPLSQLQSTARMLDPQGDYVVLCHHGMRSEMAAQWMRGQGFTNVANLAGGIDAWSQTVDHALPRY